ncbi:MAG TPA: crosslink repair DNA glycosylase YcaQ family protein, partial [Candidatus Limnocylindria bacterium]|nr:crosslink repair DNA glycosylase YcaQ family protein [Candidatus Limnocylindria bacterium]
GPVSTDAFRHLDHRVDWWWAETRAARAVMEALFVTGRLGIARRDGNRRFYDLVERLFPADLLAQRVTKDESLRHRLLSRHRAVGLMGIGGGTDLITGTGSAAERAALTARLTDDGLLVPVQVEGMRERRHLLADELPLLDATRNPADATAPSVSFMAPLDPLLWDRRLLQRLFGFDYTWEIYTPAAKRRYGYYALPILFGDRFIGRIEPRLERRTRTLRVLGVWFEPGFEPMQSPGFLPALRDAMDDYRRFVGARSVTWPRGNPGRRIAGALRRL